MSWGVPSWVERDFRAYLKCGILAHGFARARCDACGHERLVAFSCKGRGVCPSCNSRRMAEVGAHLTDHVLPWLPVRQWVLSVPKRLRPYLHHDPEVAGGVLHVFLRAIRSTLRDASPGAPRSVRDARMGAVSFLHRFGSSLNAHFHYHVVVLDGVFSGTEGDGKGSAVRFHEASALEPRHWEDLQHTVQRRVLRYFRHHDLLDESTTTDMLTWQASGGFSIDASVRIEGHDRRGIERLVRYCARPPFALHRLHAVEGNASLRSSDARLLYRLPAPTPDGRSVLVLSPLELLQRLARLIPPPRIHRHRYHGVLAPNAKLRTQVIALGRRDLDEGVGTATDEDEATQTATSSSVIDGPGSSPRRSARIRWAQLLARIYEVLPLLCPSCGGQMRILAFLTDPPVVSAILLHLDLPHRPPRVAPARGPPQGDFLLDQSPTFDLTEPEPEFAFDQSGPEYNFDQSIPDEFDD